MSRVALRGYELQDFNATKPNFAESFGATSQARDQQDAKQGTFAAITGRLNGIALSLTTGWDVMYMSTPNVNTYVRAYFRLNGSGGTLGFTTNMSAAANGLTGGILTLAWDEANVKWVVHGHQSGGSPVTSDFTIASNPTLYRPKADGAEWVMVEVYLNWLGINSATDFSFRINGGPIFHVGNFFRFTAEVNRITFGMNSTVAAGSLATAVASTLAVDDISVDDGNWCGHGCVRWSLPAGDSARGANWLAGAGGTTNLFQAIDNTPPVGIAAATNTSQIRNAAKDIVGVYDATMQTYQAAGIPDDHDIFAVQPRMLHGPSSAAAIIAGLQAVSTPAIAEFTDAGAAVAIGTHPVGWRVHDIGWSLGVQRHDVAPVLRVRKGTSSTTGLHVELMAIMVEARPRGSCGPVTVYNQAVKRGSLW